jgi:hypothetical protein
MAYKILNAHAFSKINTRFFLIVVVFASSVLYITGEGIRK